MLFRYRPTHRIGAQAGRSKPTPHPLCRLRRRPRRRVQQPRRRVFSRIGRNMPEPIPVILLGQLVVDTGCQGRNLGSDLLVDAVQRAHAASDLIGSRAIVVPAIDERAKSFYTLPSLPTSLRHRRSFSLRPPLRRCQWNDVRDLDGFSGPSEVVRARQVHPEPRRVAEKRREPQRDIHRQRSIAPHQPVDARRS